MPVTAEAAPSPNAPHLGRAGADVQPRKHSAEEVIAGSPDLPLGEPNLNQPPSLDNIPAEENLGEHRARVNLEVGTPTDKEMKIISHDAERSVKIRSRATKKFGVIGVGKTERDALIESRDATVDTWQDLMEIGQARHSEWRSGSGRNATQEEDEAHAKLLAYELSYLYDQEAARLSHDPSDPDNKKGGAGRTISQTISEFAVGKETDSKGKKAARLIGTVAVSATAGLLLPGAAGVAGAAVVMTKAGVIGGALGYLKAQRDKNRVALSTEQAFNKARTVEKGKAEEASSGESVETLTGYKLQQIEGTATEASLDREFRLSSDFIKKNGPLLENGSYKTMGDILRAALLIREEGLAVEQGDARKEYFKGEQEEIKERQQRARTFARFGQHAAISAGVAGVLAPVGLTWLDDKASLGGFKDWITESNAVETGGGIPDTATWDLDTDTLERHGVTDVKIENDVATFQVEGPNGPETHSISANAADANPDVANPEDVNDSNNPNDGKASTEQLLAEAEKQGYLQGGDIVPNTGDTISTPESPETPSVQTTDAAELQHAIETGEIGNIDAITPELFTSSAGSVGEFENIINTLYGEDANVFISANGITDTEMSEVLYSLQHDMPDVFSGTPNATESGFGMYVDKSALTNHSIDEINAAIAKANIPNLQVYSLVA